MSSRRALGLFLWLYPASFRRAFGDEMLEVFALRSQEVRHRDGLGGVFRLWGRTLPGVVRAAFLERVEERGTGGKLPSSRLPRKERAPMDRLVQDFRFGLRTLVRNPAFTVVVVLTLGLGIGINTAVFSLVNAFLWPSLPHVDEPGRLVTLFTGDGDGGSPGVTAYMDYLDFEERVDAFEGFAAHKPLLMDFLGGGETERVQGMIVSANYFDVLGVRPAHGRFFTAADDDEPGAETVAVLGHALWQERFAGDPGIVGGTVVLNGRSFDVIGIAPADFRGTILQSRPQVFAPFMMQPHFMPASGNLLNRRGWSGIFTVARIREGVSFEQARDNIESVASWIHEAFPEIGWREYTLVPLEQGTLMPRERGMIVQFSGLLMGVMALVLAVACVNVANLMLARSVQRRPEIAVRQALGADRASLFRQLLIESLTLSLAGGAVGLLLAFWSQSLLRALPFPLELDLGLDARVVGFAAAASVLTGIVFGFLPAFRATRVDVADRMRRNAGTVARAGRWGLANGLVVAQVALTLVLLVGAGLFARTLVSLGTIDLGFDTANVLVATVDPGLQGYEGGEIKSFYDRLMPRIESVPGVERASLVSALPGPENDNYWTASIEGYAPEPGERFETFISYVAAGYFETIGISVVQGRGFRAADAGGPFVAIVNETGARQLAERTGRNALGARLGFDGPDGDFGEIVGIVADSTVGSLRADPRSQVYLSHDQIAALGMGARMSLVVRTGSVDPLTVLPGVRAAVVETDPNVPVFASNTLEEHLSATLFQERLSATVLGFSAALSLFLASVGLYSVLSYAVARRTKEMGIRMALGARTAQVRHLVVRQGMVVVGIGATIGIGTAFAVSSLLSGFLYGVAGTDPATYAVVIVLLAAVSLLAAYVPARRATRVDPLTALRTD
ncbi:MAG: ABC transporter permease [Acidobacteria bacterium]|nr:ABC transporter permease [Acidobacteriota bacterium]